AGARVALVDADMRNPRVHKVTGVALAPGLAEAIEVATAGGAGDLHAAEGVVPGLSIVAAGKPSKNPAEILAAAPALEKIAERLRSRYDRVVIDAPPAAGLSDPTLLAPYADGTLFVVSSRVTGRRVAQLGK